MGKISQASLILTLAIGCLVWLKQSGAMDAPRAAARLATAGSLAGELIELQAGDRNFVALYSPRDTALPRQGAAVFLHDQVTSLNSHEVIRPLRLGLSAGGWDTLALELPTAYPGETRSRWLARSDMVAARLQAVLDWLANRGLADYAIVALGDSASIALRFAKDQKPLGLRALVFVSSSLQDDATNDDLKSLGELQLPVLDIYAERDSTHITANAALRRRAAAANPGYRQSALPGATAGYAGLEDSLLSSIRAWLAVQVGARPDRP